MSREPTQEYLHECFDYVDGKLYWKERPRHHFKKEGSFKSTNIQFGGELAGKVSEHNRVVIKINGKLYFRSRLVYVMFKGEIPKDSVIDHISGNTLDDKINNLRETSTLKNNNNTKRRKDNKYGVNGIHFSERIKNNRTYTYWLAYGSADGKQIQLYHGSDYNEAVKARHEWESIHPHITERHGK